MNDLKKRISDSQNEWYIADYGDKESKGFRAFIKKTIVGKFLLKCRALYRKLKRYVGIIVRGEFKEYYNTRKKNSKKERIRRGKLLFERVLPSEEQLELERNTVFEHSIKFSVIVPLFNTPEKFLREMIDSVVAQTYSNWELCLADGSTSDHPEVEEIVSEYAKKDARIKYTRLESNEGISGNTNKCIEIATGEYLALFDHDDILHPSVLFECMNEIEKSGAEFVYTDELTFNSPDLFDVRDVQYKPDFALENLLGVNYICHLSVFKKSLVEDGVYDSKYDGSQDHEMILRLTSKTDKVAHIPKILYFWRIHPLSVSSDISAKSYAIDAGKLAVGDFERKRGRNPKVYSTCVCATHYRFDYEIDNELVDVVIFSDGNQKNDSECISSFKEATDCLNYKIHVIDRNKTSIKDILGISEGKYILFVSNDCRFLKEDWLRLLQSYVQKDEVGVVAPKLVNEEGRILENGYVVGVVENSPLYPIGRNADMSYMGYMAQNYYAHNVAAVSANGLLCRKEYLEKIDFSKNYKYDSLASLGAAISFEMRNLGYEVVLNPYSVILDKSGAEKITDGDNRKLREGYEGSEVYTDPYYNPNLDKEGNWQYL